MFYSLKLKAQNYIAGDITYTWLFGYTYKINLTTFTPINALGDPCEDSLCFGDGTGVLLLRNNGPIGGCSPAHEGSPISSTIKMNEYSTTHTYPGPGHYIVCFNQPNRSSGIVNMPNSVNQTMSLESQLVISTFGSGKNSSPAFAEFPVASGCLNNGCLTYNPLANNDVDGDSLSYSVSPCLNPGSSLPSGGTSGTFSIDPVFGLLTWCSPQMAGDYNVVIKITEWRKDDAGTPFIVGVVNRDTRLIVESCTGINELKNQENKITVSPNPFSEDITISFNKKNRELFTVELLDITGRSIKQIITNQSADIQNAIQLKLENMTPGIYFLKLTGNNHTVVTKKIIKQ